VNGSMRGLGLALLMAGLLGMSGCTGDNESEAARAKPLGDPGIKAEVNTQAEAAPQSPEEWMKRKGDPYQAKGYPGTKAKKK